MIGDHTVTVTPLAATAPPAPPPAYAPTVLADTPLAYYRMGDPSGVTMTDTSGNARPGTYGAGPLLAQPGALVGDTDTAVTLNGTTQFCLVASAAWLDGLRSLEVWFKTTAAGMLLCRDTGSGTQRVFQLRVIPGGVVWYNNLAAERTVTFTPALDGNWHHAVLVFDNVAALDRLYMDGVQIASYPGGTIRGGTACQFAIGCNDTGGQRLAGSLDELGVYAAALTPEQVAYHYAVGKGTVAPPPDPPPDPVDITCLVDQVAIRHGRDDADSQPEASSATLDLAPPFEADAMPGDLEIGATVTVETTTVTGTYARFVGRVTDISYGWEDAGPDTPNRLTGQVIAVSPLADLGRRIVGDTPWPQELDGARVAAVLAAAGVVLDPLYSDPGTVQILARDVDSQPALEVASGTAESANGLLWQTRAGEVRYADANHRRGATVALTLDACDVLVTPTWKRSTAALLNRVSLGYGPVPEEGEQPRYVADRPDSVARYGRYELSTETELAAEADATALGQLLLTRNAAPVWVMSELPVDMKGLDPARTDALLDLDMHALVALTGLPSAGAAPTTAQLWLEGWAETLAWGTHEITLAVTGYCRTVPAPRWNDTDPAWTWDTTEGTWDEAACLGPPLALGRWDDTPASTRWDLVPPATTWDTWK